MVCCLLPGSQAFFRAGVVAILDVTLVAGNGTLFAGQTAGPTGWIRKAGALFAGSSPQSALSLPSRAI